MTEPLTYRQEGDYLYPNLSLPEESDEIIHLANGKYGLLRRDYLEKHRPIIFLNYLTRCTLTQHLAEIQQEAYERMELLTRQMAAAQGVTEKLKADDQMKWVGLMNNIRSAAEEIVLQELIYD